MNKEEVIAAIFAFITVVYASCDRNLVTSCMTDFTTAQGNAGADMAAQCSAFGVFKTCVDPHRALCKDDAIWSTINQFESSFSQLCGGGSGSGTGPGTGSGCQVASCMTPMQKYNPSGESGNQQIEATPEMCAAAKQFKTCVEQAKPTCPADDQIVSGAEMMITSFETICGGCSPSKMQTCVTKVQGLVSEEFKGFPTAMQINAACPKMQEFVTCINPVKAACATLNNEQGREIVAGIDSAIEMVDLMCGDEFKNDFLKYGNECFDKPAYKNATKLCESKITPAPDANSEPEPESKEVMCKRVMDTMNCYVMKVEGVCSEGAANFAERVEYKLIGSTLGKLGCPTSGAPRMSVQIWLFISVLLAAVLLS